ncbi:Cyn operon transcriptional activator [Ruegeria sp. THAF57]|uniref:LysR family transcriptional regulator n=1 Tax=Ruegeria sp. THAF57 TaxID=2744555 RepID=UPI0015DE2466|nr:LysR family transcriptional regulator [Ruegeria sp. THAF57]CAD0187188.1 Cyn operon transcriptional activator [Ruegeria sp. THAF57]
MRPISDIRILNAFVAVAQEGNISRAAKRLHLTQPAVSLQLKRLAEDTGLELFHRTSKGVELTRDGEALVAKAEKVQSALSEFGLTARRINGNVRGSLRLGTIVDPDFIRLGTFLAALLDGYPDLQTKLVHGISGDVVNRLINGQVDVGFFLGELDDFEPNREEDAEPIFFQRELTKFTYRVIAPAGWGKRLVGKDWTALAALPWIGTPENSVHNRLLTRVYKDLGCQPEPVCLVDQEPSMLAMVRSGIGLSLCRESIALEEMQSRGIAISEKVKIETCLRFATLAARKEEPNVQAAFDALSTAWN